MGKLAQLRELGTDVLTGLRNQFLPCPQPVTFIHLPKCAGTSLKRALARCYQTPFLRRAADIQYPHIIQTALGGPRTSFEPAERIRIAQTAQVLALYFMTQGRPLVMGHLPFHRELYEPVMARRSFLTVLRDPTDRWISNYQNSLRDGARHPWRDLSLDEFLKTEYASYYGRSMATHLAGVQSDESSEDAWNLVKIAQENLHHFTLIGFVENLEDFVAACRAQLSLPLGRIPYYNRASQFGFQVQVTSAQRAQIDEFCAPDRAVFEYAQGLPQAVTPQ